MPVTLRNKVIDALKQALIRGQQDVDSTLTALNGEAVQRIHAGLEGTDTAVAFDEKISELITQLKEALPAFEALGTFVVNYLEVPRGRPRAGGGPARLTAAQFLTSQQGPALNAPGRIAVFSRSAARTR